MSYDILQSGPTQNHFWFHHNLVHTFEFFYLQLNNLVFENNLIFIRIKLQSLSQSNKVEKVKVAKLYFMSNDQMVGI